MPVQHDTFKITRRFRASSERLFAAWADPKAKATWFVGPQSWRLIARELDFRIGGNELLKGVFGGEMETYYTALYYDIVLDERIVYSNEVRLNSTLYSVSLSTVEIQATQDGSAMEYTEQIVYFGGDKREETPSRIQGTEDHFARLATLLGQEQA